MKNIALLFFMLISFSLSAQKKATYVKLERTACFGKCPAYVLEIFSNGNVKYTGTRNVPKIGTYTFKIAPQKVKSLFVFIEKNKIMSLSNVYEEKASDLPRLHLTFKILKKGKSIKNAQAGPAYLNEIGSRMDAIWNDLYLEKFPAVEEEPVIINGEEGPVVINEEVKVVEPEVFTVVEQMPEFPGGESSLFAYINNKLVYPTIATEQGLQGKVIVNFVVFKDGSIGNVKVVRGLSKECDAEAIRVVKSMPKWKPGRQNGMPVNTQFNLPINFKLD